MKEKRTSRPVVGIVWPQTLSRVRKMASVDLYREAVDNLAEEFDVRIFAMDGEGKSPARFGRSRTPVYFPASRKGESFWKKLFRYPGDMEERLRECDGLHCLFGSTTLIGVACKIRWGVPFSVRYTWTESRNMRLQRRYRKALYNYFLEKLSFVMADALGVGTKEQGEYIGFGRSAGRKLFLTTNYVDTSAFRPKKEYGLHDPVRFLCVGRLEPILKNPALALDAISRLKGVSLTLVGDGAARPALEERIRREGLPVALRGWTPHRELPAIMSDHDIYLKPSRMEGIPKDLLEAMACGLPIVSTDVPGARSLLSDGRGVLCGSEDASAMAEAMNTLISDEGRRRVLGEAAREHIERYHTRAAVQRQEREMIKALLGLEGARPVRLDSP